MISRPVYCFFALLLVFFCRDCGVLAQTSSASWIFPVQNGLIVNNIDAVVLQWTSNYESAWVNMWCQLNDSIGNDVKLASSEQVQPSGSYSYNFTTNADPGFSFPVQCHANVGWAPNGQVKGVDDPVGITFEALSNVMPNTFSLNVVTTTANVGTLAFSSTTSSLSSTSDSISAPTSTSSSITVASLSSSSITALAITSLMSTTSSTVSSSTTAPSPISTNVSHSSSSGGISSSIKAAIIATAAIIFLVIVGTGLWAITRQRKRKRQSAKSRISLPVPENIGSEFRDPRYGRYELEDEAQRRHELEASRDRPEMEGDFSTRELEGSIVPEKPPGRRYEMEA